MYAFVYLVCSVADIQSDPMEHGCAAHNERSPSAQGECMYKVVLATLVAMTGCHFTIVASVTICLSKANKCMNTGYDSWCREVDCGK